MELNAQRLLLKPLTAADITVIHRLHSIPETDEYNTLCIPSSVEVTADVVNGWLKEETQKVGCVTLKDTREFIGLAAMVFKAARFSSVEIWPDNFMYAILEEDYREQKGR